MTNDPLYEILVQNSADVKLRREFQNWQDQIEKRLGRVESDRRDRHDNAQPSASPSLSASSRRTASGRDGLSGSLAMKASRAERSGS